MKKFGELTRNEQFEIFSAWLDGKKIEFLDPEGVEWIYIGPPAWRSGCIYRIASTKPSANWDHVHPDYNYLATDACGKSYFYPRMPNKNKGAWVPLNSGCYPVAEVFISFKPGTCDWQDSLVVRPGYEEARFKND